MSPQKMWSRNKSRSNQHLQSWIRLNRIIDEINEDGSIFSACLSKIAGSSFGGYKSFFLFLSYFANMEQLTSMYEIIKDTKQQHITKDHNNTNQMDLDTPSHQMNHFAYIPNELIAHICQFLSKSNIRSLKLTSRQISVLCLEEQTKIGVSVLNTNELLLASNADISLFHFTSNTETRSRNPWRSGHWNMYEEWAMMKRSRHSTKKRFCSLYEEWQSTFNIAEENQLLFQVHTPLLRNSSNNAQREEGDDEAEANVIELVDAHSVRYSNVSQLSHRSFLLCDKRDIVLLTEHDGARTISGGGNMDKFEALKEYKPIVLEYFDVTQQKCEILQMLLCHKNVTFSTVLRYLEYELMEFCPAKTALLQDLCGILQQMNYDENNPKLCVFQHDYLHSKMTLMNPSIAAMDEQKVNRLFYTFQVNFNHPWFASPDRFYGAQQRCAQNMHAFHRRADEFCKAIDYVNVYYIGDTSMLQSTIDAYHQATNDIDLNVPQIQNPFNIRYSKTSLAGSLRLQIAESLGGVVDARHIELLKDNGNRILAWNQPIGDVDSIEYDIVLYDTQNYHDEAIYTVNIYEPYKGPHPLVEHTNEIPTFTFKYKRNFTVKKFVNDMFKSIYQQREKHVLWYQYRDLLNSCFDGNARKLSSNISCILSPVEREWNEKQNDEEGKEIEPAYLMNDRYKKKTRNITEFDLYMLQTGNSSGERLEIRFVSGENADTLDGDHWTKKVVYSGLPLVVWIQKRDTLQHVIDSYLGKANDYVQSMYRVNAEKQLLPITDRQRVRYKPYYEFIRDNDSGGDFVIVLFKQHLDLLTFPQRIHHKL